MKKFPFWQLRTPFLVKSRRNVSAGLQSLDEVDVREVSKRRAVVMKSVLHFSCEVCLQFARQWCMVEWANIDMEKPR